MTPLTLGSPDYGVGELRSQFVLAKGKRDNSIPHVYGYTCRDEAVRANYAREHKSFNFGS